MEEMTDCLRAKTSMAVTAKKKQNAKIYIGK
jgi:hypothetical protein